MTRTPDTVRAVAAADPRRPILVQVDHTRPDPVDLALTVIPAWELIGDLQALVARHPAPTMPALAADFPEDAMSAPAQLPTGPLKFGDHVGHRDTRTWWTERIPGRVVAVDTTRTPARVRVHPTQRQGPDWEADADDLVRLGRRCECGDGYDLGTEVTSGSHAIEAVAPDGTAHCVHIPPSMVVDVYERDEDLYDHRCLVRTADGSLWDVAGNDLLYVTPRQ